MSLDQVWSRLCDKKILKQEVGERTATIKSEAIVGMTTPDKDGFIRGRDKDGNPIKGKFRGKSLARELMEKEEQKKKRSRKKKRR